MSSNISFVDLNAESTTDNSFNETINTLEQIAARPDSNLPNRLIEETDNIGESSTSVPVNIPAPPQELNPSEDTAPSEEPNPSEELLHQKNQMHLKNQLHLKILLHPKNQMIINHQMVKGLQVIIIQL